MNRLARLNLVQKARSLFLAVALLVLFFFGLDHLVGVDVVAAYTNLLFRWVPLQEMDIAPRLVLGFLGVVMPVMYLLLAVMASRLERGIVGRGQDGENICLKPEALERVVTREVRSNVPDVTRIAGCSARQGTRGPVVQVDVALSDRVSVPEVRNRVLQVVRATLSRMIGIAAQSAVVRIRVVDVVGAGGGLAPAARPTRRVRRPEVEAVAKDAEQ